MRTKTYSAYAVYFPFILLLKIDEEPVSTLHVTSLLLHVTVMFFIGCLKLSTFYLNIIFSCCEVCAKQEGEICGGSFNLAGVCDFNLKCVVDRNNGVSLQDFIANGICKCEF